MGGDGGGGWVSEDRGYDCEEHTMRDYINGLVVFAGCAPPCSYLGGLAENLEGENEGVSRHHALSRTHFNNFDNGLKGLDMRIVLVCGSWAEFRYD